ncbi:MAG TPA: serine/threonine-protein kinase [Lysobacter sp.]|nr:serine/threonine-protein kinase [Lysobacter sp.]
MNDDPREPGSPSRWWLNPALARLAFGSSTRVDGAPSVSISAAIEQTRRHGVTSPIDLDDPQQREFGDYELLELIGQGGMGVVYRARQKSLDREVALKLLLAGQWAPQVLVEGLRREAHHAAVLQHPNIVPVYAIGEHGGMIYYAMQLVRGRNLSQQLDADGPMLSQDGARLLRAVAEAVEYAHRLGVLHLDLKPGNILMDERGAPLVTDFGLARRLEQVLGAGDEAISGTPSYMAPEQARSGTTLSPAADVYGLGAVLYEILTGLPPHLAEGTHATLKQVLESPLVAPRQHVPGIPRDLEAIVLHCLEREPQRRYASAGALAEDLGNFLAGRPVLVRPLGAMQRLARFARREPRLATAVALAVLALLVGVAATSLQWRRAEGHARDAGLALRAQRVLAMQQAHANHRDYDALPGLAANLIAAERAGDTRGATRERLRLSLTFGAFPLLIDRLQVPLDAAVALSPDGQRLAVGTGTSEVLLFDTASRRQLWRISLAREPSFWAADDEPKAIRYLRFSPDGRYLIVTNLWPMPVIAPSGMDDWRIEVATGAVARPQSVFRGLVDATYSADGRHALLRDGGAHEVQLWDAQAWKPLSPRVKYNLNNPGWLLASGAQYVLRWDGGSVDILDPRTLTVRFHFAVAAEDPESAGYSAWDTTPDGRQLALGNKRGEVFLVDPLVGAQRRLLPGPSALVHWLDFSADGRWLVAGSEDGNVWLWQRDDGFARGRRIETGAPVWSATADPATGLIRVNSLDAASVWQLSGLADADRAAQPRAPLFRHAAPIRRYSSDLHAASGLLASASKDGEVRLWRLPGTPLRTVAAPPQMTTRLIFDGEHLVAVDGRKVTVVRAADQQPASPVLTHPQPIGFAALSADGTTLVSSSGRELRVFDWRRGRLRFPPIRLANSPMRLALDPLGRHVYAGYALGRASAEAIAGYSLADGHALAAPVDLPADTTTFFPSDDGRQLLVVGGEWIEFRDAATMAQIGPRLTLADTAIVAAAISRESAQVAVATIQSGQASIRDYDPAAARWLPPQPTTEPAMAVTMKPDASVRVAFLPNFHAIELLHVDGSRRHVAAPEGTQFVRAAAFSDDGRVLAQGLADGVLLLDATSGEWLAPPLRAPFPLPDVVAQLAFSPDGTRLLARSYFGRWLWWRVGTDTRDAAVVARTTRLLAPQSGASPPVSAAERRNLQRLDPGATRLAMPRLPPSSCTVADAPAPPRDPATPTALLDLSVASALNPRRHDATYPPTALSLSNLCALPQGLQRFGGIDFDLRAALTADFDSAWQDAAPQTRMIATSIRVPLSVARISAVEMFATTTAMMRSPPAEQAPAIANLVLHYADGGIARVPLRYQRDVGMWIYPPPPSARRVATAPLLLAEDGILAPAAHFFLVRIANPHPERTVRSLDLEALPVTWNGTAVLAMTIVPARSADSGKPAK